MFAVGNRDWIDAHADNEPAELCRLVEAMANLAVILKPEPAVAPVLVRVADVAPEAVPWLWPGRIALGKLTLLAGDPGLGKSFVSQESMTPPHFPRNTRVSDAVLKLRWRRRESNPRPATLPWGPLRA